jgi:hypothetical protein
MHSFAAHIFLQRLRYLRQDLVVRPLRPAWITLRHSRPPRRAQPPAEASLTSRSASLACQNVPLGPPLRAARPSSRLLSRWRPRLARLRRPALGTTRGLTCGVLGASFSKCACCIIRVARYRRGTRTSVSAVAAACDVQFVDPCLASAVWLLRASAGHREAGSGMAFLPCYNSRFIISA